jgi:hypothetical protein
MKKFSIVVALAGLAILLLAGYAALRPRHTPDGQTQLVSLEPENLADFQSQFNDAAENVRVLLLLSPT